MTALSKCLLLCCLMLIQSCSKQYVKPEIERKPPLIQCQERKALDPLPEVPDSTDWRNWAALAAQLFGLIEQGEGYRLATAECLDKHRMDKDIR